MAFQTYTGLTWYYNTCVINVLMKQFFTEWLMKHFPILFKLLLISSWQCYRSFRPRSVRPKPVRPMSVRSMPVRSMSVRSMSIHPISIQPMLVRPDWKFKERCVLKILSFNKASEKDKIVGITCNYTKHIYFSFFNPLTTKLTVHENWKNWDQAKRPQFIKCYVYVFFVNTAINSKITINS